MEKKSDGGFVFKGEEKKEKSNFLLEAMRTLPQSRLLGTLACEREEI